MKINQLLLVLVCVLNSVLSYANESKELNFLKVYEEKIKTLSEKIQKQEEIVKNSKNKVFEFGIAYVETVKQELKNKKGSELTEREIKDITIAFEKNYNKFASFFGKKELPEKKIFFSTEFFENCPDEYIDQIAILKFYITKYIFDLNILKTLIDEWENLIFNTKIN